MYRAGLHAYAIFVAFATLVLITAGGVVTTMGAGLSVADWPTSYGTWLGPERWFDVPTIRAEHGHRLIAATVGLLIVILCIWAHLRDPRRWLRRLTLIAVVGVICQGLLGGLTVLLLLPLLVSATHACLAQAIFCLLVSIVVFTSRPWVEWRREEGKGVVGLKPVRWLSVLVTLLVFSQLVLGALMRHAKDGEYIAPLAITDFPLAMGRLVPPLEEVPVILHFVHRMNALAVAISVIVLALLIRRKHRERPALHRPSQALLWLVLAQITLGALTVLTNKSMVPTTAHVVTGAVILTVSFLTALAAHALPALPRTAEAGASVLAAEAAR